MAIWIVPKVQTLSELENSSVTNAGEIVYLDSNVDSVKSELYISQGNTTDGFSFVPVAPDSVDIQIPGTEGDALVVTNAAGDEVQRLVIPEGHFLTSGLQTTDEIPLASLESYSEGNVFLTTDQDGVVQFSAAVGQGEIVGRAPGGALQGQKLHTSMVSDNSLPYTKLNKALPGHVLGVAASEDVILQEQDLTPISIDEIAGNSITSSTTPPQSPGENDLWYYNGENAGDNARLYIYQGGIWVDASPAIVNTNPGIDGKDGEPGPEGPMGSPGTSVEAVTIQDREAGDDIVLEFYKDTLGLDLINSISIPAEDFVVQGLPSVPDAEEETETYVLEVSSAGDTDWKKSDSSFDLSSLSVSFTSEVGVTVMQAGTTAYPVTDFAGITAATISGAKVLTYNGLVLIEGTDYTVTGGNTITLAFDPATAMIAGQNLQLTNFTATLSQENN